MTVIKFENGKPTLRDGQVGTDAACCDQCCGGVIHTEPGDCCKGTFHPESDPDSPCPEGEIFLRWGAFDECCGCVPATIFDGRVGEEVSTVSVQDDLCCPKCTDRPLVGDWWRSQLPYTEEEGEIPYTPAGTWRGCIGRCCGGNTIGGCQDIHEYVCDSLSGTFTQDRCCTTDACPVWCCNDDGSCTITEQADCPIERRHPQGQEGPFEIPGYDCLVACRGGCCVQGEDGSWSLATVERYDPETQTYITTNQLSAGECATAGGRWQGPGSTSCPVGPCCESVTSSAASLTFTPPDDLGCADAGSCALSVTVTVRAKSPVCVRGTLMGGEGCTEKQTFVVCNGRLDITPGPGKTTLDSAYVEVCWAAGEGPETINFDCCGSFFLLGNCDCSCVTTLVYDGAGCTSSALLQMRGDAVVNSSGSGPLVLTSRIGSAQPTPTNTNCDRTLTLAGSNDDHNEIRGIFRPPNNKVCNVIKDGAGTWRLNRPESDIVLPTRIGGLLHIKNGTLREANGFMVPDIIDMGDTATGASGKAVLYMEADSYLASYIQVKESDGSQVVMIGGGDSALFYPYEVFMDRDVTFFADTGTTVINQLRWHGPTSNPYNNTLNQPCEKNITFGTEDHAGKVSVQFYDRLYTSGMVTIAYGEVELIDSYTVIETVGGVTINEGATLTMSLLGRNDPIPGSNPGGLATSATFTHDTLTVDFSGDPTTGDEYILLLGPTNNTIATVTLTGTTKTGTYDSATSTLTID
jgi:hypothetical protein